MLVASVWFDVLSPKALRRAAQDPDEYSISHLVRLGLVAFCGAEQMKTSILQSALSMTGSSVSHAAHRKVFWSFLVTMSDQSHVLQQIADPKLVVQ